jgi:hypothetical protein
MEGSQAEALALSTPGRRDWEPLCGFGRDRILNVSITRYTFPIRGLIG